MHKNLSIKQRKLKDIFSEQVLHSLQADHLYNLLPQIETDRFM